MLLVYMLQQSCETRVSLLRIYEFNPKSGPHLNEKLKPESVLNQKLIPNKPPQFNSFLESKKICILIMLYYPCYKAAWSISIYFLILIFFIIFKIIFFE